MKTTVFESLFNKVVSQKACNFIKAPKPVSSCEYCETFKHSFFHRTPPVAASVISEKVTVSDSDFLYCICLAAFTKMWYLLSLRVSNHFTLVRGKPKKTATSFTKTLPDTLQNSVCIFLFFEKDLV